MVLDSFKAEESLERLPELGPELERHNVAGFRAVQNGSLKHN